MRSRTEMITTTLEGSEYEDEMSDGADSEDDWKPTKANKGKRNSVVTSSGRGRKRKSAGSSNKKTRRQPAKRSRKYDSDESDEDDDDVADDTQSDFDDDTQDNDDDKWKPKKQEDENKKVAEPKDEADDNDDGEEPVGSTNLAPKPLQRKPSSVKCFPDKDGFFDLFMFKNDLTKNYKTDDDFCLWRRDGSSLLQKYVRLVEKGGEDEFVMVGNSVYSCWEERSKNEHFQIKVQFIGNRKDGKVKVVDVSAIDKVALTCGDVKIEDKAPTDDDDDDVEKVDEEEEDEEEEEEDDEDNDSDDE